MPTLAEIRAKEPALEGLDDDHAIDYLHGVYYPQTDRAEFAARLGVKPPSPPTPERSAFAVANDTIIETANAAAGGVSSAAEFVSPGNRFSKYINENIIRAGEESQSDAAKQSRQQFHQELDAADTIGGEVAAVGRKVLRDPLLTAAQAAGSFALPGFAVKAGGGAARLAGLGVQGATRAGLAGGAVAGAGMAGGDAAGTAYELVINAGGTEEQAQDAARRASVVPAMVGGAGGMVGAERLLAGAKGAAGGTLTRALKTAGIEGVQEGFEEGVTQYSGQLAATPYDPTINPTKGVAGAAALGAVLGAGTGAGMSLLHRDHSEPVPEVGPLSQAANISTATMPKPAEPAPRPIIPLTAEQEKSLLDRANARMQELEGKEKGTKETKEIGAGGVEVVTPAVPKQFLTPAEKDERDFLKEAGGDVQALAHAFEIVDLSDAKPNTPDLTAPPPEPAPTLPQPSQSAFEQRERDRQPEPTGAVLDGDILNPRGEPFKNMAAAMSAQKKAGEDHEIVRVAKGLVVRRKAGAASDDDSAKTPAVAPGAGTALSSEPGGSDGNRTVEPGVVGGNDGATPVAPVGRSPAAQPVDGGSEGASAVAGKPIDAEWTAFAPETGTKGVPRADMPQIKAAHRGAMTNFLNARGIDHEITEVPASSLKPTQAEFSPAKVQKALDYAGDGGDRSILVSSDGHVLDGHHQWLARLQGNEPVKVIRLNAQIADLLEAVRDFPSASVADGATESAPAATPEGGNVTTSKAPDPTPQTGNVTTPEPAKPVKAADLAGEKAPEKKPASARVATQEEIASANKKMTNREWVNEGKTPADLMAEKVQGVANELAFIIAHEAKSNDFAPSDLPIVIRQWAQDTKVDAAELRHAVLKELGKTDASDGRRAQIARALDPLRAAKDAKPAATTAAEPAPATEKKAATPSPTELRKRISVLKSLLECMA